MADGEEVQRRVEVPFPESEIGGGDRRREAVVEGFGQAEPFVDAVPAELDRELVDAQLAGVEEAEDLDPLEVALTESAELLRPVLVQMPGVVGLLGSGGRQRQQVRGRDVGGPPGASMDLKCSRIAPASCTCSIVCRKTTASQGSAKLSTRSRSKRRLGRV